MQQIIQSQHIKTQMVLGVRTHESAMSPSFLDEVQERLADLSTKEVDAAQTPPDTPRTTCEPLIEDVLKSHLESNTNNAKVSFSNLVFKETAASLPTPPQTPLPIPTSLSPTHNFIHRTHVSPKTQRFACSFIIFLLDSLTDTQIGQIQARYIDRAALRTVHHSTKSKTKTKNKNSKSGNTKYAFHLARSLQSLNDGDSDGYALATHLLSPSGSLLPKYQHPIEGDLTQGGILVLNYIHISPEFRRKGFAKLLLGEMVPKARTKKGGVKWVFVKPGAIRDELKRGMEGLDEEDGKEFEKRSLRGARGFYRGVGFEEIGGSEWLVLDVDEVFGCESTCSEKI